MPDVPEAVPDSPFEQRPLVKSDAGFPVDSLPSKLPGKLTQHGFVYKAKFSQLWRLLRVDGFDRVVGAKNLADKHVKIFFAFNSKENARLGIIASKRVFPRAVDRNRAKRLIREVFRQHSIKVKKLDMVVMLRQACAQDPGMHRQNLEILFSRLENRCADL